MTCTFTCPECDTTFGVPADAPGAILSCTACPWTGIPTYVDSPDLAIITVGVLAD